MASLREIRKRLHSIQNIQQLTKAVEMVAASHLHRALIALKYSQLYITKIKRILDNLTLSLTDSMHPLLEQRKTNKIGLVVITADLGLTGSYNKDILIAANQFLKDHPGVPIELILIGRKGIKYYNGSQWTIRHTVQDIEEARTFLQTKILTNQLIDWFIEGEFDEIWCVYTHYTSMFSRTVMTKKFLNINKPKHQEGTVLLDYIFEPSSAEVYAEIVQRYCLARMQLFLGEAHASELSARVLAMKTATKNADEMLEKLTLVRNKIRQADITKEMLEITSGAENLK